MGKRQLKSLLINGKIIDKKIFNGIFAFEEDGIVNIGNSTIKNALINSLGIVNNICFEKDMFLKYWDAGMPRNDLFNNCNYGDYAVYQIKNLAFGYFISMHGEQIPDTLQNMFYPIKNTKEVHRVCTIKIKELR